MKVALFGGSFNPIHNGHVEIANQLLKRGIVNEVWYIPCGNHPFSKKLIDGQKRLEMIKLAVRNDSRIKVLDIEIKSKEMSFTSETIKTLKNRFKETDFYLIIGSDNLPSLNRWHDFDYLKNNVKFILVKRPGFSEANNLSINVYYILDSNEDLSSTLVRGILEKNQSVNNLVPMKVAEYIQQRGLYG